MDLHRLAREELPPPPARVLEVGCGSGKLARKLAADGYDVVAVDPKAPEGAIFRRTTIEALGDEGPFDAAVASLSLHHVDDLDVVMRKVHSLLRPGSPFVVREFGWDLVDEPTARWDHARAAARAVWRSGARNTTTCTASRRCAVPWTRASKCARSRLGRTSPNSSRARATPRKSCG